MVGLGERDHPANVACLVLSLLPLLPGPMSFEHKRTHGRQLPGDPKEQKMGEGKCQSQEGAEDGCGEGAQGQCSGQRRGARGRPVLETTWEDHRQNGGGRMETERRQLRKSANRLAGREDSWDAGAFGLVLSAHACTQNLHVA